MAKSKQKSTYSKGGERIGLSCACGNFVDDLTPDIKAVTCWICIAKAAMAPAMPKQVSEKSTEERPRGWQRRKEYTSPSGTTYSFGKEVTNDERISSIDFVSSKEDEKPPEIIKRKRGRPKGVRNKPK